MGSKLDQKGSQEAFFCGGGGESWGGGWGRGDEIVLCLDCGGGYMTLCICQSP